MKKNISILIPALLLMLSACGGKKEQVVQAEGLAKIEQEWKDISIKVENGLDKPTVMQLLRAFNDTWQTAAADSIFAEASGKDYYGEEWYAGKSSVFVDNEDFCTAWYNHGDTGEQLLESRTYPRDNGHMLFAVHLEQQNPEQLSFCCFYDYDPKTQMMTPEEEPYKDFKRKWPQSVISYQLGLEFDLTIMVIETNKDEECWYHHYVWNGMKHEFHHSGPDSYHHEDEEDDQQIATAPEEDWTEEAVEKRIREYFEAVNKTFADGSTLSPFDLDKQFYTNYWNEVYEEVNAKDGRQKTTESCFFIDDNHWTNGLQTPVEVKDVKVELLTGDTAEAVFTLVEKEGGFSQKAVLELGYQRGFWCINNWLKKSHDPAGSILSQMEKYIGQ